jgi:putative DNA primase/helicase
LKLIAAARVKRQPRKSSSALEVPSKEGPRPLTELGNAERLVAAHGEMFRYCGPRGDFLVHDGQRWVDDQIGQMERLAKTTVRAIYQEAAEQDDATLRGATAEWAKRSEKAAQIAAMLRLAASETGVPVLPSQMDTDPWLLNVANGTIDLRTGTLRPHRREDLITRLAPVEYRPAAKCPRWLKFLSEVFEPHPDIIPFIQVAAGYSLTGDIREECLFLLHGKGRNGKGTLLKILATLMGDYAGTSDFSTFIATRDDRGPRDHVANMKGLRLVTAQEAREGAPLAESIVKWLTGGDRVRARKLHENSSEFDPTWKIWLASNHKPTIKGQDSAIWSRIWLVPFDASFEGREDRTLKTALLGELPGVLAWAVEGCLRWQAEGLPSPNSVLKATGEYRSEAIKWADSSRIAAW